MPIDHDPNEKPLPPEFMPTDLRVVVRDQAAEIERLQAENAKLLREVQLWANAAAEDH